MYVLEELLLADSLEKIIRMERYLNDVILHASEDDIKIVEFYKDVLEAIKNELEEPANLLKKYHKSKINDNTSVTFIRKCLNISIAVRIFHEEFFSYLPILKTRSETYIFLKNLLQQIIQIKTEPAIVLTDIYNYEERNITQSLKEKNIIKDGKIAEQIIIGLPKTEKDNPLMWTILVHEIGHDLAENYLNISSRVIKEGIIDKKIDYSHQTILKNWAKEIISDILSIRVIGPSYLYSFIFYNLLISDLDAFSNTHPSPNCRIEIMLSALEQEKFELKQVKSLYYIIRQRQKKSKSFISVADSCSECGAKIDPISEIEEIKKEFYQLVSLSIKIIDEIKIKEYTPDNLVNCEKLVDNLNNSIPISSSRKMNNKKLNDSLKIFTAQRFFGLLDDKNKNIYSLLEQFEEKPNSISDIINAGWLHKINNSYSEFIKLFFENDEIGNHTFDEKYENYKKFLNQNDELLLKSFEIADMHLLLEFGRNQV